MKIQTANNHWAFCVTCPDILPSSSPAKQRVRPLASADRWSRYMKFSSASISLPFLNMPPLDISESTWYECGTLRSIL